MAQTMNNTAQRADFWKDFIVNKAQFPYPEKLRAQFAVAELSEFCDCGCNSFKVDVPGEAKIEPIAQAGKGEGMVFEANFQFTDSEKTLEILLFANATGNLSYVEIDCSANSCPVPEIIDVNEPPFHSYASEQLLR
jgi:hypothetical protein